MLQYIIELIVLINPFALFLYLLPVMKELDHRTFVKVLIKASVISLSIFLLFLFSGTFLFQHIFRIDMESFRIFGGIIIFTFAFLYIVRGDKAFIRLKQDMGELPSDIALPFMVGAGTISLCIFVGGQLPIWEASGVLVFGLLINFAIILTMKYIRDHLLKKKLKLVFDRVMDIFLRLNGFFVGAIGIDMLRTGLENLYF